MTTTYSLVSALALPILMPAMTAHAGPAASTRLEVPVERVFVPAQGFDDNDNVEVVLDGLLPNGCYSVADHSADQLLPEGGAEGEIRVHLFAYLRSDGPCGDQAQLPPSVSTPVPFTLELSLGRLSAGKYRVTHLLGSGTLASREFSVSPARVASVDNMPYAAVSSVWMPDSVYTGGEITTTLVGSLTSSCSRLPAQIAVKKVDDVFVVLPGLEPRTNLLCAFVMTPFERPISLGPAPAGRYLIHVRSMNGRAVDRVFSVVPPPTP